MANVIRLETRVLLVLKCVKHHGVTPLDVNLILALFCYLRPLLLVLKLKGFHGRTRTAHEADIFALNVVPELAHEIALDAMGRLAHKLQLVFVDWSFSHLL